MTAASPRHRRLRLIVGAPGAGTGGIQDAFVQEVQSLKSRDPLRPLDILVGSNYLRLHLQRLLAVRLKGHANVRFLLLKDLAAREGAPALMDRGRRRLPDYGRDLLLEETAAARCHGTYFERISGKAGFLEALGSTLRDLKEARVEPATLRAAASALRTSPRGGAVARGGAALSSAKLEDLADLFETYDDLLRDRRFYDEEDLMREAAERAGQTAGGATLVYGFYDANWTQRSLIQEHMAFKDGAVFFPFETGAQAGWYDYARPLLDWFASWIPSRIDITQQPAGDGDGPDIKFLSAPGEPREAVEATRWLVARARDRSIPFGEMGLVYRTGDQYERLLPDVMEGAGGVPCFLAQGRPLALTPAARTLTLLMEVRREGFSRRSVIDLLALAQDERRAAHWDRLSREAGVVRGIDEWRHRLERLEVSLRRPASMLERAAFAREERLEALEHLRRQVEDLHAALAALPLEAPWTLLAGMTADLVRRFAPPDTPTQPLDERLEAFGGLDEVSSPVSLERFFSMARRLIDEGFVHTERDGEFQKSGIFIGDVIAARLLQFQALAIIGLVEKSFPVPPRQDPILLDEERETVNNLLGAGRLPLKTRRLEEERLLFRMATRSAAESLLLSYPRLDPATARPRNPSYFLLRAAAAAEGRPVDHDALESLPRMMRVGLAALAPREARQAIVSREFDLSILIAAARSGPDGEGASRHAPARIASFLHSNAMLHRALEAEAARWGESRFTAHDGVILRPNVFDTLRQVHPVSNAPMSASRIESYASCPLRYFLGEVLGLRAVEEPEEAGGIDPRRRGLIIHSLLFDLFTSLRERGLLPLTDDNAPAALEVLDRVSAARFELEDAMPPGPRLLWAIEKERIHETLADLLRAEAAQPSEFTPAYFEIRYGSGTRADPEEDPASIDEPVRFEIQPGRFVALKGRIDRIDISEDGSEAVVTDYKTGVLDGYGDDALRGGTSVQLPLYMIAAEKLLEGAHPGIRCRQARYLAVGRGKSLKTVTFGAEALGSRRQDLARVLNTVTNGITRGVFFAYPERRVCARCDFQLACGEGRETRFSRKRADWTASDFLKMREEIP